MFASAVARAHADRVAERRRTVFADSEPCAFDPGPLVIADPKKETPLSCYTSEAALLYQWIAARPGA